MGRNVAREKAGTPVAKKADLYSWAVRQAALLREGRLAEIDAAAIAEEIDDVGEEEYHRLESALRVVCCTSSNGIISRRSAAGRGRCEFSNTDDGRSASC